MSTRAAAAQPPTAAGSAVGPITSSERIEVVDILRGFALFGILLVNMALFKAPWMPGLPPATTSVSAIDQLAAWAIDLFATGKFFTLFSFLFGFGFAMQMLRAQERGAPFVARFTRRLLVLLAIGLTHALLIWYGDILVSYALLGFVLILFRNRSPRALLIWAAALLILATLLIGATTALNEMSQSIPEARAQIAQVEAEMLAQSREEHARDIAIYGGGSYFAIVAERAQDYQAALFGLLFMFAPILAMFLLGLYAGKRRILHDVEAHLALLRRVRFWGLLLGFTFSALAVLAQARLSMFGALLAEILHFSLVGPVLSMGYAATIVLLARDARWRARLAPLGAAGRMALTNYLMQSLICTTIFYGYGLGLYGQVGAAIGIALAVVIYALQIPFSAWWLARFRFGPAEWLWRSLTYGRRQPMRRTAPLVIAGEPTGRG
jgi:uncharacterized protein